MPQFDFANFAPQIAWLAVFFAILYFVIVRATVPKLARVIDEREGKVTGDIAAAEVAKADADRVHHGYETEMAQAHVRAQGAVADAKASATRDAEVRLGAANETLHAKAEQATASLEAARRQAAGEIERIAAEAAADIVAVLVGTRPDADTARTAARQALAG
ncbi:ATPase [Sphingomonas sp.]|uniref:F0F1 ATP synthase subunit B family protein n=1 Tax=Sphingomonas sp. TaxID=28214 RepID=UPI003AFF7144